MSLPLTGASRLVGSDSLELLGQGRNLYPVRGGAPVPVEVLPTFRWTPEIADISGDGLWAAGSSRSHAVSEAMIWDSKGKGRVIGSIPFSRTSSEATGVSNGAKVVVGNVIEFDQRLLLFRPIYPLIAQEKDQYRPQSLLGFLYQQGFTAPELAPWNLITAEAVSADGHVITGRCRPAYITEELDLEDDTKDLIYILTLPKPLEILKPRWEGKLRP